MKISPITNSELSTLAQTLSHSSEAADSVVDDLDQQDVLPPEDVMAPDDSETITGALTQAGHWDEPASDLGHRMNKQPLEDEVKASEQLVNKGLDDAEEELRDLDDLDEEEDEKE